MADGGRCPMCGAALPPRERGRRAVYCSSGCRQRAYRERSRPRPADDAAALVADVERRAREMVLDPAAMFRKEVEALAKVVRQLRKVALAEPVARAEKAGSRKGPDHSEEAFAELLTSHRRHLHLLCYRLVGSHDDADDLLQETFLRAWRDRDSFQHRSTARTWLHRIATNVCLDHLRRTGRRPQRYTPLPGIDSGPGEPPARMPWLQPYPDRHLDEMLDEIPAVDESTAPEAAAVSRETLEL